MLDLSEHPKEWQRRVERVKGCLPSNSPLVARLDRAYSEWRKDCAVVSDSQQKRVEAMYEAWLDAIKEIDRAAELNESGKRADRALTISIVSITLTCISILVGVYFQYESLAIQKQTLKLNMSRFKLETQVPGTAPAGASSSSSRMPNK